MSPALEEWRRQGRAFAHKGHAVFLRETGDGSSALMLIHGFPTASWDWHAMWSALAQRFPRLLAPDMIGFGFSAKPADYHYSIFDQADLHEALARDRGVREVHLLAHDYGDTVAQELLARYEERSESGAVGLVIHSCCLLNGGLFPEVHRARLIQKLLLTPLGPLLGRLMNPRSFARSFARIFGAGTQPTAEELAEFWSLIRFNDGNVIMHRLIRYMAERRANRERWVGALQRTRVPLRFINGPDDPISGAHMVARYRELVPHADVVTLPGIGHYPQVENARGVLDALAEFHARLERSAPTR